MEDLDQIDEAVKEAQKPGQAIKEAPNMQSEIEETKGSTKRQIIEENELAKPIAKKTKKESRQAEAEATATAAAAAKTSNESKTGKSMAALAKQNRTISSDAEE